LKPINKHLKVINTVDKMNNSSSIIDWVLNNQNSNTINIVQQSISLLFGLLIFLKSYDFEACLKSVREKREAKRKEKERKKLLKFRKLMELAKQGGDVDISKVNLSEEAESSEEKVPDSVLKMAHKKKRKGVESV